ncbi:MAG: hypothetical protein OXQ94_17985 [Gemmatimonadota bacterium]|nr:hypothetical protein [Gemmatimonadota bacterium]MDE2873568.1 hypothetical protein [Gemmatimonadota bacterium]
MTKPLHPTLSALYTRPRLLALLPLPALVPSTPLHAQQVPEVRNTEAELANAPMLMLAEEVRFAADESGGAFPPGTFC